MHEATDYYLILEIDESAAVETIKHAYRRLAIAHHPDRNPGDVVAEERFKVVQQAYEVLSNPTRRAAYDRARRNPFAHVGAFARTGAPPAGGSPFAGSPPFSEETAGPPGSPFDPLFSFFFSDEPRASARGADVEAQHRLTFDQALRGGKTDLQIHDGTTMRLLVPRGVRSGVKIRVPGHGRPGAARADGDNQPGDLYVTLRVDPSSRFRREADHLHVDETISAIEAIIGTTRSITNAYGQTIKVAIPPGTQPGERLRLRGQGVVTEKRAGDLFVEVHVTVPRQLSDEQRAELEQAAQRIGIL